MREMLATVDWYMVAPLVALAALGFGVLATEVRSRIG
jgi:hypothetical protein